MLTRRRLLSSIAFGGVITSSIAPHLVQAMTIEATPKPLADLAALRCTAKADTIGLAGELPTAADHTDLLAKMRVLLRQKIAQGADPATVQETAVCPLCGCALTVTAQSSF